MESVAGIQTLKATAVEPQVRDHYEDKLAAYINAALRVVTLGAAGSQLVGPIGKVTSASLLCSGAQAGIGGPFTIGDFVAFNMLAGQISGPVLRLAQLARLPTVPLSADRLGDILNAPVEVGTMGVKQIPPPLRSHARFEDIGFRYGKAIFRMRAIAIGSGDLTRSMSFTLPIHLLCLRRPGPVKINRSHRKSIHPRRKMIGLSCRIGYEISCAEIDSSSLRGRVPSAMMNRFDLMAVTSNLNIEPVKASSSLRDLVYTSLKSAIANMDIYGQPNEVRLDERKLSVELGVSRTPVREALTVLEQEGFVRSEPRRGVFVVRKTKLEIVEMIYAWAALESMAARLACASATDEQLRALRTTFPEFYTHAPSSKIDDYSNANIRFHQTIISYGNCRVISDMTSNLFMHVRGIRSIAIRQDDRVVRSTKEHQEIINALEQRDSSLAEYLVRNHALGLSTHVLEHQQDF